MSTDKTLADVQPGGMVRLGDGLPPLPKAGYVTGGDYGHEAHNAFTPEQMRDYALAALSAQSSQPSSLDLEAMLAACVPGGDIADPQVIADNIRQWFAAQPSPGGQGDARAIIEEFIQCATLGRPHGKLIAQAKDYLAARQPVGEPVTVEAVATVRRNGDGDRYIDWLTEGGIADLEVGDVLIVSDRAITDEDGSGEVYAARPAQAVDLGKYRHALLRASGWARRSDVTSHAEDAGLLRELLDLIDSQAVGNGN